MVIPDINLLVYAYNKSSSFHGESRLWWENLLNTGIPVGLPWVTALGFVRIMTDFRIMKRPMNPLKALSHVKKWLEAPSVRILEPGLKHLEIMDELINITRIAGGLTTDLHIASLAIEFHGEVHSNDRDFARFPNLRFFNPLEKSR